MLPCCTLDLIHDTTNGVDSFDSQNQNMFQECVTQPLDGAHEVLRTARMGFTTAAPSMRAAGGTHGNQEHRAQAVTIISARANTRWDHDPGFVMHETPGTQDAASGSVDGATAAHAADIDAELSKLQLHEWASEQRLSKLESQLHEQLESRLDMLETTLKSSMGSKLNERIQALEERIRNTAETALVERIAHLEQQFKTDVENKLMNRVEGIEQKLRNTIDSAGHGVKQETSTKLTSRLTALEKSMKDGLSDEITKQIKGQDASTRTWVGQIAQKLDARAESGVAALKQQVAAGAGDSSWQMPFVVLVVLVLAAAGFMWKQYQTAQKQHLF